MKLHEAFVFFQIIVVDKISRIHNNHSFNDVISLPPGPTKTLFVRGLSEDTTDQTLRDAFEGAAAARIVTDRDTGSSKG